MSPKANITQPQVNSDQTENAEASTSTVVANHCRQQSTQTLLSTVLIYVFDKTNKIHECRALLDVGSQSNFITESLCSKLNLPLISTNISVAGISHTTSTINKSVTIKFKSRINPFHATITCLVLPKISENIPILTIPLQNIKIPQNIELADPNFNQSTSIDMLLGAELFWKLLCAGQIQLNKDQPNFQKLC